MSDEEQPDKDIKETRLKKAFTEGPFEAYEKLIKVKWTGESVDA